MGMNMDIFTVLGIIGVASFVLGGFFGVRGFYRFKEWQAGEKDELWTFLSLILGCGSLILIGIPSVALGFIESMPMATAYALADLAFIGLLLGLAAIGLMTFYYIQKWQSAK